jgi:hypothetical protein
MSEEKNLFGVLQTEQINFSKLQRECFSQLYEGIMPQVQKCMRAYHVPFDGALLFFFSDLK